jgi:outer membrane protein OmpA-like peptidoglycan-associated protein
MIVASGLFSTPALAQDADTFDLSASNMDGGGTLQRHHPHLSARGSAYAGAAFVYAKDPLVGLLDDGSEITLVSSQFSTRFMGGYNFDGKARLDLDLPMYPSVNVEGTTQFAMGDIRLGAMIPIVDYGDEADQGLAFGVTPVLRLPTATEGAYVSNGGFGGGLTASVGGRSGKLGWVVDAGTELGPKVSIGTTTTGSTVDAGAGVSYGLADAFRMGLEFDQRLSLAESGTGATSPTELHGYGTYGDCEGFFATLGGGAGVVAGVGAPAFRVMAALNWRGATCEAPDTDGDGITDDRDACVNRPEDMDGVEDEDGCPEDNDKDGIADKDDSCPNDPGPVEFDGCPDSDGDGVVDPEDACPARPGDPALMGCPDTDQDGFQDDIDKCPEVHGGEGSKDGCPVVVVTREAIEIRDKVYFETDKAVILAVSHKLLNDVASVLQSNAYIKVIEIQGHTDDQGSDQYNLELSNRRAEAVRRYLMSKGVDADRLVAKGYGESAPVEPGSTDEARAENRRVEFKITKQ